MKKIFLFFPTLLSAVLLFAQTPFTSIFCSNGNTTGAKQTPLSLGNWASPVTVPSYYFYTVDAGATPLEIHSTRWSGALNLTRDDPAGTTNIMTLAGWNGWGASMNLYNTSNQPGVSLNTTGGDSYFNSGNLVIGATSSQGYKLAVNGSAIFTRAVVKLYGNWPDYVFGEGYELPSLKYLKSYLQAHHHLPELPSAGEVEKKGIDLGANQTALLKKVEELTLYTIRQQDQIDDLQKQINELKKLLAK
ncbi:MAG TPA: hypothetical protein VNS58_07715 [Puia sp.]|nr:hypothetical protein [Puia sp.]